MTAALVVLVTYNSAADIEDALDSLSAAAGDVELDVVVVDNGSVDQTVSIASARGDCAVVSGSNVGYAAAINRGVAASTSDGPILVLNPDTRCEEGSIARMVEALQARRAIVAPRMVDGTGRTTYSLRQAPSLGRALGLGFTGLAAFSEAVTDDKAYLDPGFVSWATGAALLVPRACHEALGGWDESYFLYSEETDFCLRAADQGWRTYYEPGAVVRHTGKGSGWNPDLYAMQILNRVRLYRRRSGPMRGAMFYGLSVLRELTRSVRGDQDSRHALGCLLRPATRPPQVGCQGVLVPR